MQKLKPVSKISQKNYAILKPSATTPDSAVVASRPPGYVGSREKSPGAL
jgi:hypothetical protein